MHAQWVTDNITANWLPQRTLRVTAHAPNFSVKPQPIDENLWLHAVTAIKQSNKQTNKRTRNQCNEPFLIECCYCLKISVFFCISIESTKYT